MPRVKNWKEISPHIAPQKKAKKTWGRKIHETYDVGDCKYCNKDIDSDMSFVVFATKEPAHFRCYQKDYEKENRKNIYL